MIADLEKEPPSNKGDTAIFYGASEAIPTKDMGDEMLRAITSALLK